MRGRPPYVIHGWLKRWMRCGDPLSPRLQRTCAPRYLPMRNVEEVAPIVPIGIAFKGDGSGVGLNAGCGAGILFRQASADMRTALPDDENCCRVAPIVPIGIAFKGDGSGAGLNAGCGAGILFRQGFSGHAHRATFNIL